jgi:biopolymer transport protein ExbB/TolQ
MAAWTRFQAHFVSGGFTLLPLVLLSIYSLALIWERSSFYRKALGGMPRFLERLRQALRSGDPKEAVSVGRQYSGVAGPVALAALIGPVNREDRINSVERVIGRQIARLEERLVILGTIGSVSPFIGLFGTVLGVMRAFKDLAHATGAGPGVVAVGISEALVATAAGLFVAIPAVIAYNVFTSRANRFADEMRWFTDEVLERLTEKAPR